MRRRWKSGEAVTTLLFRALFSAVFCGWFFPRRPPPRQYVLFAGWPGGAAGLRHDGRLDPRTRAVMTEMVLAIANSDAQRCTQLALKLTEP
jgi:ubiquinone biosynthesis protein